MNTARSFSFGHIALIYNDLDGLPSFEAETKSKDPRYRWFMEQVGTKCYELDAMPPPDLRACVTRRSLT